MYHLDPNINTAVERQTDRMHAVRALRSNSNPSSEQAVPPWTNRQGQTNRIAAQATMALAAATPIALALILAFAAR